MINQSIIRLFRIGQRKGIIGFEYRRNCFTSNGCLNYSQVLTRLYAKDADKKPLKEEQIDSAKMPGFVHPQTMHDEGYFTQKAKQQLEEMKKRMDKPTIDNTEKKE